MPTSRALQTRAGAAFSPWNADAGVPLHTPTAINFDALLRRALAEKAGMTANGACHEDEPTLEDEPPSVAETTDAQLPRPDAPDVPMYAASIFSPFSSPLSTPPSSPLSSPPPSPRASTCPLAPSLIPPGGSGSGCDGLSKAQFHAKLKVSRKRAKRRVDRAKKQEAAGTALKASAMKHRSGGSVFATDFALIPENVHLASTGVIGRAIKVHRLQRKEMPLQGAKKLGFQVVSWSGMCVATAPS